MFRHFDHTRPVNASLVRMHIAGVLALSLASSACTLQKGDETESGSSSSSGSSSGSSGDSSSSSGDSTSSSGGSGSTGEPTTGDSTGDVATTGEGGSNGCIETPTVLAIDEQTPLGPSAEKLLEGRVGTRETTLTFASEPTTLSADLKGKVLPLTVTLGYEGGEIRWIDSEVDPNWMNPGTEGGFPGECEDRLEIDVKLDFVTEAGEFNEHVDAVFTAKDIERAEVLAELMPPPFAGSLDLTKVYEDDVMGPWVIEDIQLLGVWQADLAGGSVMNEVHVGGEGGIVGYGPLASWGDAIESP